MEVFLIRLLQVMLAISLLVLLHEGGHFFFAKLFGVRVEKFYLFFDPWFHIFEFKPKKSDTAYGMGWLPLGGYCKIAGMIDESFDTEQMKQPEQPWEFRSKPAWQRLLIMVGGVLVNFLLALFIYSMVLYHWGDTYIAVKDMSLGMKFNTTAKQIGFQDHDILVGFDGQPFGRFDVDMYRHLADAAAVTVKRRGKEVTIRMPEGVTLLSMMKEQPQFCRPFVPATIDSVMPNMPAAQLGMKKGDKILAMNGKPIDSWGEFTYQIDVLSDVMTAAKTPKDSLKVRTVQLVYQRDAQTDTATVALSAELQLGVGQSTIFTLYQPTKVEYGFLESIPAGIGYGIGVLRGYVDDMKYVFTADGAKSLGGFGAIGSLFPPVWDWMMFWKMTAFLSIILAFMNILPIPALDGGHVLFLLYEIITRRKPSENFMVKAEYVGFSILILLMIVANLNDVLRWLGIM
ncbi:MAG: RIP metalloprotease RseP [Prevotellaceae bacterium]|nr:RIP metalloprotease RseP [Prevotella sp.]MDD7257839.1 RIP metalloprotease RseP [Prevotellaceae bacterium]MDY6131572.1 RIP metalloprotease RseP [Prevotella sp.]